MGDQRLEFIEWYTLFPPSRVIYVDFSGIVLKILWDTPSNILLISSYHFCNNSSSKLTLKGVTCSATIISTASSIDIGFRFVNAALIRENVSFNPVSSITSNLPLVENPSLAYPPHRYTLLDSSQ